MRRLTDITITTADRPAPPRAKPTRVASKPAPKPSRAPRPRRSRAASRWWKAMRISAASALALALLAGGPLWLIRSGAPVRLGHRAVERMLDFSSQAGLRVDTITVEGRDRLPAPDVLAALGVSRGDSILGVDLAAAQARLAALPGVKSATVERRLPGELHVMIAEREPVAIWQSAGRYLLIDRDGAAAGDNIDAFPSLPLVVGAGAPEHVAALLDLLAAESALAGRVKASQWISGRRWNLEIAGPAGEIEVRLPEDDPAGAWHELARLETEQKLLERKVTVVDLRLPDRLVLRVPGGIAPPPAAAPSTPARRKASGRDA